MYESCTHDFVDHDKKIYQVHTPVVRASMYHTCYTCKYELLEIFSISQLMLKTKTKRSYLLVKTVVYRLRVKHNILRFALVDRCVQVAVQAQSDLAGAVDRGVMLWCFHRGVESICCCRPLCYGVVFASRRGVIYLVL